MPLPRSTSPAPRSPTLGGRCGIATPTRLGTTFRSSAPRSRERRFGPRCARAWRCTRAQPLCSCPREDGLSFAARLVVAEAGLPSVKRAGRQWEHRLCMGDGFLACLSESSPADLSFAGQGFVFSAAAGRSSGDRAFLTSGVRRHTGMPSHAVSGPALRWPRPVRLQDFAPMASARPWPRFPVAEAASRTVSLGKHGCTLVGAGYSGNTATGPVPSRFHLEVARWGSLLKRLFHAPRAGEARPSCSPLQQPWETAARGPPLGRPAPGLSSPVESVGGSRPPARPHAALDASGPASRGGPGSRPAVAVRL